ncbi:hypothetical protein [Erythrobacter litoralis]|uniref:Uncharacterized protein n=1 Tax=Erythrobacter litoralis (strain HTCC2594) TaxID=314225 RepID=Q2N661_ERYLH|nr:hypothetical protein [Erythrobacter litoralis]ABC64830.1 hypothetical protein ELI_13690 [Erythrobacter litoralis HTCC2594]
MAVSQSTPVLAQAVGHIEKVLRTKIPIYDANSKVVRRAPKSEFEDDHPVTALKGNSLLEIRLNNETVYVRRADVRFNGPATCKLTAESRRSSRGFAVGTPGIKAGAGSGGVCVPIKR